MAEAGGKVRPADSPAVVLLWAVFANPRVARVAFGAVFSMVLFMATVNLLLTLSGRVVPGEYFTTGLLHMSHMSHMYGQALVGVVFVLAHRTLSLKPASRLVYFRRLFRVSIV